MKDDRLKALTETLDEWKLPTDKVVIDYGEATTGSADCHIRVIERTIGHTGRKALVIQRFFHTSYGGWQCSVDVEQEVRT